MKYLTGNEIRRMWLDFFKEKGHQVEAGASLVPNDDPTLLWMNAGVAALKKYFDGSVVPQNPRIVNAQKCIRTNDIEHVGKTARHHTFFEMLGNFSIGDYFRTEAVTWGFELLTSPKWFGFDKNLLYMTVYPGDQETIDLWISLGVDPSHIIPTEDDNFWEIGEGPCGPDTEIFFDRGPKYGLYTSDAIRDDIEQDRYVEIWNIVFSQYNAKPGLKREDYPELPSKNIDTGCGLERLASVIQEKETNFETDLFMPIIEKIEEISHVKYQGQMAFKVISDHIRTVCFAVSDGAMLSNEGRGYVLRRLLRRAVKYGKKLGIEHAFMDGLVDVVASTMVDYYPEISVNAEMIKKVISSEENKFLETLSHGEKRFETIAEIATNKTISGEDAFLLYDTYGFPIELTEEYAEERGLTVDRHAFEVEMENQKSRARNARKEMGSMKAQNEEYLSFHEESRFVGYEVTRNETEIIKIFDEGVVLKETPFYATSGGQVADTGEIIGTDFKLEVTDVSKLPNGQFLHHVTVLSGTPKEHASVNAIVNEHNRVLTTYNHSATHLLFKALRDLLGSHVSQQGSQVTSQSLRFDFNHYESITDDQILTLEKRVNEMISEPFETVTEILTVDEARSKGAIAEFGEKYGDKVRVVNLKYTLDLCGGTHTDNIGNIGSLALSGIYSIGSGIYRVEGYTNENVKRMAETLSGIENDIQNLNHKVDNILSSAVADGIEVSFAKQPLKPLVYSYRDVLMRREELAELQEKTKELEKEYNRKKEENALKGSKDFLANVENGILIDTVENMDVKVLKQLVDNLAVQMGEGTIFISTVSEDKLAFVCKTTNPDVNAGDLVKGAAVICGGNGGGRKDFAQAGGKDISKLEDALAYVKKELS